MNYLWLAVSLVIVCTGCTTNGSTSDNEIAAEPLGRQACFRPRDVSDFKPLDRTNLIVYAPGKSQAYQVSISPPAFELRSASAIAFSSRSSRICGYAGDSMVIGRGNDRRYSVSSVRRLDEAAVDSLLAVQGENVQPEPSEGAVIEREIDEQQTDKE